MLAGLCVAAGIVILIALRHKTSLTGCGSRRVMEAVGLAEAPVAQESTEPETSTIFGDLSPEELREIFPGRKEQAETPAEPQPEEAAREETEEEAQKERETAPAEEKEQEDAPKE